MNWMDIKKGVPKWLPVKGVWHELKLGLIAFTNSRQPWSWKTIYFYGLTGLLVRLNEYK